MAFKCPPEYLHRVAIRKDEPGRMMPSLTSAVQTRNYKAAVCTQLGKPLEIQDLPSVTKLNKYDVKVNVKYAAVNYADILIIKGQYQENFEVPFVPGTELAGTAVDVGEAVTHVKSGDQVLAFGPIQGMAQETVLPAKIVIPVPASVNLAEAASVITSYATAYTAFKYIAALKEGETVLVTAGAGGTGLAAVDLAANMFKAQVIAAVGSDEKTAIPKQYGAFETLNYNTENMRERLKEITNKNGVDVIYDILGGKTAEEIIYSLAFQGRLLNIGFVTGIPRLPANALLLKSASARGLAWFYYGQQNPAVREESIRVIMQAFAKGQIKPHISKIFDLDKVNEAFDFVQQRKSTGKVLIKLN